MEENDLSAGISRVCSAAPTFTANNQYTQNFFLRSEITKLYIIHRKITDQSEAKIPLCISYRCSKLVTPLPETLGSYGSEDLLVFFTNENEKVQRVLAKCDQSGRVRSCFSQCLHAKCFSVCLSAPMWLTPSGSSQKRRRLVLGSQSPGLEISELLRPMTPPITSKWVIIGLKRRLIIGSF